MPAVPGNPEEATINCGKAMANWAVYGAERTPLGWIMPKSVRPISARAVASALLAAILDAKPGVRVLKSGAMQAEDRA